MVVLKAIDSWKLSRRPQGAVWLFMYTCSTLTSESCFGFGSCEPVVVNWEGLICKRLSLESARSRVRYSKEQECQAERSYMHCRWFWYRDGQMRGIFAASTGFVGGCLTIRIGWVFAYTFLNAVFSLRIISTTAMKTAARCPLPSTRTIHSNFHGSP